MERRELERLLKGIVHSQQRDDVKVTVKYYVQFSTDEDSENSAQCCIDPWQPLSRSAARALVKEAIQEIDQHDAKRLAASTIAATPISTSYPEPSAAAIAPVIYDHAAQEAVGESDESRYIL